MTPDVTIAIQGYKNPDMLKLCIQSVIDHCDAERMEIVVSDSATEEDTRLMMRENFPHITFLPHEKNVGFGAMVNACIDNAKGRYVFIINPDTILEPETITGLESYMEDHPEVGLIGPAQKNFNGTIENTRFRFYEPLTILYRRSFLKEFGFAKRHLAHFEMRDVVGAEPYPVPWVIGSAMFVRREVIDKVGGMDLRYFMYMEDTDWCRTIWDAGWKVYYHPQVTLYHFYGKGSARGSFLSKVFVNKLTRIHLQSAYKYFQKWSGKPLPEIK